MKTQSLRLAIGVALGTIASVPAIAQQTEDEPTQTVIVTGSRISRPSDFGNSSPVDIIDREGIEKAGYANLQQLMEKNPSNGAGAFSTRGNNQDSTANGAASISLRGLGADATLVLVNGRRVAISPFAESITTNFVDINAIPVSAIERVEVLKDGASALYGSDAVAGVINIILRKDFEGLELSGSYGSTTESGYDEQNYSAVWGFGGEDNNVTFILDYFKNSTLSNTERGSLASANQTALGGQDFRSSRGYPGRFFVTSPANPMGAITIDPGCPAGSVAGQTCVYDFGIWNLLIPEAERGGLMMMAHQDFGDGMQLFVELAAQHNKSMAQGAPTPLDEGALLTVPITHPNNPYPTATAIGISRYRTVDAGPRQWNIETDNLRGVVGVKGKFAEWDWEAAVQRARSETDQSGDRSNGWVRTDFLQQQINAGAYNPFGGVQNPQGVIDQITTSLIRRGKSEMTMYDATISGALFDFRDDAVRMAAGIEYREESVEDVPDDQFQRGLIFGTESVSASGERDILSAYVEVAVPLATGLDLNVALRYDDYSDFGDTTNPKISLRYAPIESLAFRTSWGTGFRAPSLAQIGLGPSQESRFFRDSFGCAINTVYCTSTDFNIVFTGNPDLDAEESESFNFGVSWQEGGFTASADYWDITQDNKIDEAIGFIYQQECNNQASTICVRGAPVGTDPLGPLSQINATFDNINEQSAKGIDFEFGYRFDLGGGALALNLNYSKLLDFERIELGPVGDTVTRDLTGEYEYPEDRATLSADWDLEKFGVRAALNYIGSFQDLPDADFDTVPDYELDQRSVGSFTTLNLQGRYNVTDSMKILLSVDNALDEAPPFAVGDGNNDLYGYVQGTHNPRGRFWSARAVFNF
ncbi:MAG TPA: TonB-dependent receptor [Steroidobacteraceae bacterium]|nr:TonB-dependent receptor [Steroidobacteraceae bacterium]